MPNYIFDVDGTLTPSRNKMDESFAEWFEQFCNTNNVYLVTGSDRPKTMEQVGERVYNACQRVYQCSGNDVYEGDRQIRCTNVNWHGHVIGFFTNELNLSKTPVKTGCHVEYRTGSINFSTIGRRATQQQREDYWIYDGLWGERKEIANRFNQKFPDYEALVAGETGIDIVVRGKDKSQIIHDFSPHDPIVFFGDKMVLGGNDYNLGLEVVRSCGSVYNVKNWEHTWKILKEL